MIKNFLLDLLQCGILSVLMFSPLFYWVVFGFNFNKDLKMLISIIPFSGFYDSLHSATIDDVLRNVLDCNDYGEAKPELYDFAFRTLNCSGYFEQYAIAYSEAFCEHFKINALFESMKSPREYNFSTDRIFIKLSEAEAVRLFHLADKGLFTTICKENLTSRDGFSSFYNPDWTTWGDVTDWDHNQIGQLIGCIVAMKYGIGEDGFDCYREYELLTSHESNGDFEQWLFDCDGVDNLKRAAKIANYLRSRASR